MKTFKYEYIKQPSDWYDFTLIVEGLGEKGWELVFADYGFLVFKREVEAK